jgi:hypothetical protein
VGSLTFQKEFIKFILSSSVFKLSKTDFSALDMMDSTSFNHFFQDSACPEEPSKKFRKKKKMSVNRNGRLYVFIIKLYYTRN